MQTIEIIPQDDDGQVLKFAVKIASMDKRAKDMSTDERLLAIQDAQDLIGSMAMQYENPSVEYWALVAARESLRIAWFVLAELPDQVWDKLQFPYAAYEKLTSCLIMDAYSPKDKAA